MTKLLLTFTAIIFFSCNSHTETATSTNSVETENALDFNVALTFINDYVSFCNPKSPSANDKNWIRNNSLLSENFKTSYYNLIDSARKADPELGLDFDPIFDAQDFPEKGFVIAGSDNESGYVTVKGKDWPEFLLVLKVVRQNNKTLVDGSGVINIPSNKRAKR